MPITYHQPKGMLFMLSIDRNKLLFRTSAAGKASSHRQGLTVTKVGNGALNRWEYTKITNISQDLDNVKLIHGIDNSDYSLVKFITFGVPTEITLKQKKKNQLLTPYNSQNKTDIQHEYQRCATHVFDRMLNHGRKY